MNGAVIVGDIFNAHGSCMPYKTLSGSSLVGMIACLAVPCGMLNECIPARPMRCSHAGTTYPVAACHPSWDLWDSFPCHHHRLRPRRDWVQGAGARVVGAIAVGERQ